MSISTKVVFNKTMEQVTESRRKPIVVGIGELLWDMLPSGKKAGGAPINFVYHASCLGAEGYAISAVGDDELGKEIVDELDKNHIQHLIEKVPYPTGTVQVELREGIPTYTIHERVAWDHISPTSAFPSVPGDDTSDLVVCAERRLSFAGYQSSPAIL